MDPMEVMRLDAKQGVNVCMVADASLTMGTQNSLSTYHFELDDGAGTLPLQWPTFLIVTNRVCSSFRWQLLYGEQNPNHHLS